MSNSLEHGRNTNAFCHNVFWVFCNLYSKAVLVYKMEAGLATEN